MHAAIVVRRPPVWPVGPIVSTTERPHGENVPVAPIRSAAAARLSSSGPISAAHQHGTRVS